LQDCQGRRIRAPGHEVPIIAADGRQWVGAMDNAGMKGILIRVSVVSGVVILGLIGVKAAQYWGKKTTPTPDKIAAAKKESKKLTDAAKSGASQLMAAAEEAVSDATAQVSQEDPFQTTTKFVAAPPPEDRYADYRQAGEQIEAAATEAVEEAGNFISEAAENLAPVTPVAEAEPGFENNAPIQAANDAEPADTAAPAPVADNRYSEWQGEQSEAPHDPVVTEEPAAAQPYEPAQNEAVVESQSEQPATEETSTAPREIAAAPIEEQSSAREFEPTPAEPRRWEDQPVADAPSASKAASEPTVAAAPRASRLQSGAVSAGVPGDPELEKEQGAALVIHKTGPPEVQLGIETAYEIRVQNVGDAAAHDVEIHDVAPQGADLVATQPRIAPGPNGELVWSLGTLAPGEEITVQMRVTPRTEGEIGSVARVFFSADAAVRTLVTRPVLELAVEAPKSVLSGERAQLFVRVTNTGTGVATGVILENIVPAGFEHPAGESLEYRVGTLKPRESKELPLTLSAVKPMEATNVVSVRADGDILVEQRTAIAVVAPELKVEMQGPRRRFLDRDATYTLAVSNPGTAPAKEIELVTFLAPGMEFVSADSAGQYDPQTRAVYWLLDELPPNEMGNVTVTARPTKPGEHVLRVEGRAQRGLEDVEEQPILVEGLAAVEFQVIDLSDPVEIGGEAAYEIVVKNGGTKAASDVEIVAMLPVEMQLVAAEGPVRHKIAGQKVVFEPIPTLAPGDSVTLQLTAKTLEAGDARLQVKLLTADMQSPVTKEENTKIFGDE
jgi:uncharacterized repeat protein (TIGR01451 family)